MRLAVDDDQVDGEQRRSEAADGGEPEPHGNVHAVNLRSRSNGRRPTGGLFRRPVRPAGRRCRDPPTRRSVLTTSTAKGILPSTDGHCRVQRDDRHQRRGRVAADVLRVTDPAEPAEATRGPVGALPYRRGHASADSSGGPRARPPAAAGRRCSVRRSLAAAGALSRAGNRAAATPTRRSSDGRRPWPAPGFGTSASTPPCTCRRRTPAPAVIVAHGFGGSKDERRRRRPRAGAARVRRAHLLGARVRPQHRADRAELPRLRGRRRPRAGRLAGRRGPRWCRTGRATRGSGVTGGSYGGALSLLLAGTDKRVDALAPVIT